VERSNKLRFNEIFQTANTGAFASDDSVVKLQATSTHPAGSGSRYTEHESVREDIASNHGAGGNKGVFADFMSAHDRTIRAQRSSATHCGRRELIFSFNERARIDDISEHYRWPAKD